MESPRITAIIPARGGSKGVKRKNIRETGGKPLLVWTIEAAKAAASLDNFYVSTEDEEIAALARTHGVQVLERPENLASDAAQCHDVVLDALDRLDPAPDIVVLLQPTSPLRTGADIDACVQALVDRPAAMSATTVCEVDHHPAKCLEIMDGMMKPYTNWADAEARRQDLPPVYRQNGAVYAVRTHYFREKGRFLLPPVAVHVMDAADSIDIDDETALLVAGAVLKNR